MGKADIDFPPKTAAEFFQRGLKSAQLGMPDKAAADFEEAAWLDPDNQEVQFNLGVANLSMADFEQAINRAVAHAAIGEDDKSEADVAEAVRLGAPPDGLGAVIDYVKKQRG